MNIPFPQRLYEITQTFYNEVPSTADARLFADSLIELLFPFRGKLHLTIKDIENRWELLQREFFRIITPLCNHRKDCCCRQLTERFFAEISPIYTSLVADASMYDNCDPASFCSEEIILAYPGFYAVMIYRLAHVMHNLKIPILPRVISEYAHAQTGIDIHPGATIGHSFFIDHGTGVVIGETAVIGSNVKIYQGVTLGALFVNKEQKGVKRHPQIDNNVIIYAGSTILGGDTVIGHDSVIGGNVWLTESVPPYSKVYHRPEIVIKEGKKEIIF